MSEEKLEEVPPTEAMKRPTGLTIIAILWFLGGIYNLYMSSQVISVDLEALQYLSYPLMPEWFKFGVPAELAIGLLVFALGLIQMFTIYGLWTGKSWSYKLALAIPLLVAVSWILQILLYVSAPSGLGISESINWVPVILSIFWLIVYWSYLGQPHVKEYLGVTIQKRPTEEVPDISVVPEVPKGPRKSLMAILLIVIVVVASVSVFAWWHFQNEEGISPTPSPEYSSYSKYGFSIEYPKDMTITEEGVIDATANDDSGVVMGTSFGPYESVAVSWAKSSTPLTRGDLENALEEIFNTPGFERTGNIVETTKSDHEMIYQRCTYTEAGRKNYCIFGVGYCNIDKKLYCLGTEQTTEQDVLSKFQQYLDSFVCH